MDSGHAYTNCIQTQTTANLQNIQVVRDCEMALFIIYSFEADVPKSNCRKQEVTYAQSKPNLVAKRDTDFRK